MHLETGDTLSPVLQAAARLSCRPWQAWAPQQLAHFSSKTDSATTEASSSSDAGATAADAADQAAADEQEGSMELSELQELLKKAEEEVTAAHTRGCNSWCFKHLQA